MVKLSKKTIILSFATVVAAFGTAACERKTRGTETAPCRDEACAKTPAPKPSEPSPWQPREIQSSDASSASRDADASTAIPSDAPSSLCSLSQIEVDGGCEDGTEYCSLQKMQFVDGRCEACADTMIWDSGMRECRARTSKDPPLDSGHDDADRPSSDDPRPSPSDVPDRDPPRDDGGQTTTPPNDGSQPPWPSSSPTPMPDPTASPEPSPAVRVTLRLSPTGDGPIEAKFSSTKGVRNVTFSYPLDRNLSFIGRDQRGATNPSEFTAREIRLPIVLKFMLDRMSCTLEAEVGLAEQVLDPICQ